MMTAADVLRVLRALEEQGVTAWLSDGGWGVDALLGKQTRPHNDLDLIVSLDDVPKLRAVLGNQGFRLTEGQPPLCFVLADGDDRMVDVHPVAFDDQGNGHYTMAGDQVWVYPAAGFAATGVVDGQPVRCLTAEVQVLCHAGYQLREVDFHDMQALHRRFGVRLLPEHQRPSADNRLATSQAAAGSRGRDEPGHSVAGLFSRAAAGYDRVGFFHQIARRLLTLAGVRQGMRVLDVACGTGAVLVQAARLTGPAGLAVGIDFAEPMAAVAARQLQRLGQGRGAVAVMDAERLGVRAGWFDVVCCASAIYLLGDQAAAVRGWWELLRPAGRLAISEFGDLDVRWAWKEELLGRFGPRLEPMGGGLLSPEQLEALLRSTGGGMVRVQVERLDVVYATAEAWWAEQWAHGERRPLERMNPQALGAYRSAAFSAIEACREADGAFHWRPEAIYAVTSR